MRKKERGSMPGIVREKSSSLSSGKGEERCVGLRAGWEGGWNGEGR